eukprot:1153165-Pelagomonas_calceolata.AAC.5
MGCAQTLFQLLQLLSPTPSTALYRAHEVGQPTLRLLEVQQTAHSLTSLSLSSLRCISNSSTSSSLALDHHGLLNSCSSSRWETPPSATGLPCWPSAAPAPFPSCCCCCPSEAMPMPLPPCCPSCPAPPCSLLSLRPAAPGTWLVPSCPATP